MFSRRSVPCTNSGQANGERKYQILFNWPSAFWLVVFTNYTLPKQYTPLTAIQNFVGETCAAPKPPWGMKNYFFQQYGILLPKLFWPTVRKKCSRDREKLLKFKAEGREFARFLRSLEQFIQTVKGQNNFW